MSRNPVDRKPPGKKAQRFNDVRWINWSLSAEEKATVKAWQPDLEEFDELLLKTIQAGHKVTVGYDSYGDCYSAAIVPTADSKTNQGYILTGKGSTPQRALKQALYIHLSVFGGDWSTYSTGSGKEELDD